MARILVVDDESDIRTLIQRYAEREGHGVTTASDGLQAVELCKQSDFDIIIMDIMMPEMDGFTACKEIKKTRIFLFLCSRHGAKNTTSCLGLRSVLTIML